MKKIFSILIIFILFLSSNAFAFNGIVDVCPDFSDTYYLTKGTTPRIDDAALFETISDESVKISNQIYENLIKFSPDFYLLNDIGLCKINGWKEMSAEELESVKESANEILSGCTNAESKIEKVSQYLAKNICYDYDYYTHNKIEYEQLNHNAYDVLKNETAVCYGYAATAAVLLQLSGVPCVLIHSPNHVWNMAYNGERWVLFDSTWMSNSRYEYEQKNKSDIINYKWFDFDINAANSNRNHIIESAEYCEYNNTLTHFPVYSKYKEFTLPDNIKVFGKNVFANCSDMVITYNGSPLEIGNYAFYKCKKLNGNFDLKNTVSIGRSAFYECETIDGVINLKNADSIGKYSFRGCINIDKVYVGDKITILPYCCFYNCRQLEEIRIGKNVSLIDEYALNTKSDLKTIYYPCDDNKWGDINVNDYNFDLNDGEILFNFVPSISAYIISENTVKLKYNGIAAGERAVMSEYKNGDFQGFSVKDTADDMSFSVTDADTVKFFVLDDIRTLIPITKSVEISLNN